MIRGCHHSLRACVTIDDDVCLGWLSTEQGLRHESILAPFLLFNIFFTAVLNVALAFFRLDPDIVEYNVHGEGIEARSTGAGAKERSKTWGAEGALREVWGTRDANDAGIASHSPESLSEI